MTVSASIVIWSICRAFKVSVAVAQSVSFQSSSNMLTISEPLVAMIEAVVISKAW